MTSWGRARRDRALRRCPPEKVAVVPGGSVLWEYPDPTRGRPRGPARAALAAATSSCSTRHRPGRTRTTSGCSRPWRLLRRPRRPDDPARLPGQRREPLPPRPRARAAELGLGGSTFFPGFVSPLELRGLYRLATGLVFPSRFEGWGLPVCEAFSEGLPVASSTATSLPGPRRRRRAPLRPRRHRGDRGRRAGGCGPTPSCARRSRERGRRRGELFSFDRRRPPVSSALPARRGPGALGGRPYPSRSPPPPSRRRWPVEMDSVSPANHALSAPPPYGRSSLPSGEPSAGSSRCSSTTSSATSAARPSGSARPRSSPSTYLGSSFEALDQRLSRIEAEVASLRDAVASGAASPLDGDRTRLRLARRPRSPEPGPQRARHPAARLRADPRAGRGGAGGDRRDRPRPTAARCPPAFERFVGSRAAHRARRRSPRPTGRCRASTTCSPRSRRTSPTRRSGPPGCGESRLPARGRRSTTWSRWSCASSTSRSGGTRRSPGSRASD